MIDKIINSIGNSLNSKTLVFLFFSTLYIWIGFHLFNHIQNNHGFILGDWLVNYHDGGFKRRGLSGSLFFLMQDITGIDLKLLVYFTQMALYLLFFVLIGKIISKKKISLLLFSLILSPLTFLFYFNDTHITGRKEIILFIIFAYFLFLVKKNKFKNLNVFLICLSLLVATLLHEIVIFYIPYFVIALYLNDQKTKLKTYALVVLSTLVPTLILFFLGGLTNEGESIAILSERGVYFSPEKSSIFDFSNALLSSLDKYRSAPIAYSSYAISLIIGIAHFWYYMKKEAQEKSKKLIRLFLLAILWIQIHFVLLLLILVVNIPIKKEHKKVLWIHQLKKKNIPLLIPLILFFFTWRVYHFRTGFNLDGFVYSIIKKSLILTGVI